MDFSTIEMLKQDLAKAIHEKNYLRVEELKQLLNISDEQAKYFDRGLTGYPSVDRTWLQHYRDRAEELANNIPLDKTVWDVIEEKLIEYYDVPALEYFKKQISREDFRNDVYMWARTFRAMGVEPNEIVPFYGPFFPDICEMCLALNMIGACPYFLKLAISPQALEEETRDAKVAIVFDGMWTNVAHEFSKDKFKKVIVATATDAMPNPKKEIVSFLSYIQSKKNKTSIPKEKKYLWIDDIREIGEYYTGETKVPFEPNRSAFITSSSGTTVGGLVKGTVATNESTISQLYMGDISGLHYYPGEKCLNHFPPTASTSLNILYLFPLYKGMTVLVDPRVSKKDFYRQVTTFLPNVVVTTGNQWEEFFNQVYEEMKSGKKFDFSCAKEWAIGGEGTEINKFKFWNEIMKKCHATNLLFNGYGSSELFSATAVETNESRNDYSKPILSVGIPYAGLNMGVFDKDGNELSYNQRGELWTKSQSAMKEYYGKPELTQQVKQNGWIHTGDLSEIDPVGRIYIWGRLNDTLKVDDNTELYLFDIAQQIKSFEFIDDAIVLSMPLSDNKLNVVAHIVINSEYKDKNIDKLLEQINEKLLIYLPENVSLGAYRIYDTMLPYSPTTMKKDKNKMSKETNNYVQIVNNKLCNVSFFDNNDGTYEMNCDIIEGEKVKKYIK